MIEDLLSSIVCSSCGLCCSRATLCEKCEICTLQANGLPVELVSEIRGLQKNPFSFSVLYKKLRELRIQHEQNSTTNQAES